MKLQFPIFAKILLWFFLNLVLLGAGFYAFFHIQFETGLDSLLAGQAGDRVEALSTVIGSELKDGQTNQWTVVLRRFQSAYGVKLYLFNFDGRQLAGDPIDLPGDVRRRFWSFHRPGWSGPSDSRSRDRGEPPPPDRRPTPETNAPDRRPPPEVASPDRRPPSDSGARRRSPKFMVRTSDPVRYWVGVWTRLGTRESGGGPPRTLIAMSENLSGGGLFIDFRPWVLAGFGALILSILFWLPLIRGITRSVSQMTHATEQVAEGRFDVRVDERRRDELGRLGQAVNRMAVRLKGFVGGQKRFLGDVAHELCSPLARIQVALGILEQRADEKQQDYVADVREEVQHMSSLVNELLSFSKAGLREKAVQLKPVDLSGLLRRVADREADEPDGVRIEAPDGLQALAEPDLLSRAVANLVRNALRYAGRAGPVTVGAAARDGQIVLSVADSGPGVPEDKLQQIFDPFFRLESSRSVETGGVGLGLTIVKTCVEACQGTVIAKNRQPSGLLVEIRLKPAAPA